MSAKDAVNFNDQIFASAAFTEQDDLSLSSSQSSFRRAFSLPQFLDYSDTYYYKIKSIAKDGLNESNFTDEFKVLTVTQLPDPINFTVTVLNSRVKPITAKLTWEVDNTKTKPDYWIISRKIDTNNEVFTVIGKAYIQPFFLDFNLLPGNTYLYNIQAIDTLGRASNIVQATLTL